MDKIRGDPTDLSKSAKRKTSSPSNPSQNTLNFSMKNLTSSSSSNLNNRGLIIERNKSPHSSTSTKNIGVGTRHSSISVAVGHGTLGSINGPSSVTISAGHSLSPLAKPCTSPSPQNLHIHNSGESKFLKNLSSFLYLLIFFSSQTL